MRLMSALFRGIGAPSFDRLYRRHAAGVYRYVYAVLGNHADAEDVTQQTFLNAYRAMAQGTKPRKAENWLLTIAHNEVRRHFRRTLGKPMEVELDEELADPTPDVDDPSLADVLRALQHLPPSQRAALVMREFEGRSYAEIAEILDVTPDALERADLPCPQRPRRAARRGAHMRRGRGRASAPPGRPASAPRVPPPEGTPPRVSGLRAVLDRTEAPALAPEGTVGAADPGFALSLPRRAGGARGDRSRHRDGGRWNRGRRRRAAATGALGLVVKAAAVTASAAVVGGVGYGVSTGSATAAEAERRASHVAAVGQTRLGQRAAEVHAALSRGERPGPARPANARSRRKASKPKTQPARARAAEQQARGKKQAARRSHRPPEAAPKKPSPHGKESRKPSASRATVPRDRAEKTATRGGPTAKRTRPVSARPKPDSKKPHPDETGSAGGDGRADREARTGSAAEVVSARPTAPPNCAGW